MYLTLQNLKIQAKLATYLNITSKKHKISKIFAYLRWPRFYQTF